MTHVSSNLGRASALFLAISGAMLLIAGGDVLPALAPGTPASASWVGQLLAGAWLGVAVLNWLQRHAVMGGIYGRPTVLANLWLYSVSGLSLVGHVRRGPASPALWLLTAVLLCLAAAYGWLLARGPDGPGDRPATEGRR